MLCGSGCAARPIAPPAECVPDVIIQERLIGINAELLIAHPCPSVPYRGDVAVLLDWTENCAISARMMNDQLRAIRSLQP